LDIIKGGELVVDSFDDAKEPLSTEPMVEGFGLAIHALVVAPPAVLHIGSEPGWDPIVELESSSVLVRSDFEL